MKCHHCDADWTMFADLGRTIMICDMCGQDQGAVRFEGQL